MKNTILILVGIVTLTSCQTEVEKLQENVRIVQVGNDSLWKEYENYGIQADKAMDSITYGMGDKEHLLTRVTVFEDVRANILSVIDKRNEEIKQLNEKIRKIELGLE